MPRPIGVSIKLLATSRQVEGGVYAMVKPGDDRRSESPVQCDSRALRNAIFCPWKYAGGRHVLRKRRRKASTASAVAADVVDCVRHLGSNIPISWGEGRLALMDIGQVKHRFFVRLRGSLGERLQEVEAAFGPVETISVPGVDGEFAFITSEMPESEYKEKAEKTEGIISMIRARF